MSFSKQYLQEAKAILDKIPTEDIENLVRLVVKVRDEGGRIFFLGVGGSAANASHAVNDFRKICGIECYTPIDNVSELTARVNDDGWDTVFVNWLKGSSLSKQDMIFVFSVGGGNLEKNVSANIVKSLQYAKEVKARIGGIVGRDGGYTACVADACIVIPTVNPDMVTPHTEAFQGIIWHLVASHPLLHKNPTKWESVK
ncbi:MAG: SIS domain-containing protein [Candidatus Omnitrophica bacterium]|nr:SIS domain-containing protein [Candidatus Omnitrophota bacterium]MDD5671485.1 SIS domain-containing protein [Candidatus Omnitrophota bacterium]